MEYGKEINIHMEKCAFESNNDKCTALVEKKCDGCKFRKTEEQVKHDRQKSLERLDSIKGGLWLYKKYYPDGCRF